ncbi:MAG: hypothetical protein ACT6FF_09130 [Methanosarcinaceae archaeon]
MKQNKRDKWCVAMPLKSILNDQSGWIDFILSKIALIIASVIIISATFQLAADFKDVGLEHELGILALDFKSDVDNPGSDTFDSGIRRTYSFDTEKLGPDIGLYNVNASISGEYVEITATARGGRKIHAVKPLMFKVLPFNESTLRYELEDKFGHNGTIEDLITSDHLVVTGFLSRKSADKVMLNTSIDVFIQKTIIYVENGYGVYNLEYTLVYQ